MVIISKERISFYLDDDFPTEKALLEYINREGSKRKSYMIKRALEIALALENKSIAPHLFTMTNNVNQSVEELTQAPTSSKQEVEDLEDIDDIDDIFN